MKLMRPNIAMLLETGEEATVRMQIGMGWVYECNLKKKKKKSKFSYGKNVHHVIILLNT